MVGEFEIIEKYFAPLAGPEGLSLIDDAALFNPPEGMSLVLTKDISVSGVHFPLNTAAEAIGWRSLAVNLSDLAAKGAKPLGYLLGLGLTGREDAQWLADFSSGLKKAQLFGRCTLFGGDTVRTGERLTVSITAIGTVPVGKFVTRSGAQPGDVIYITGTMGDAALGLACIKGTLKSDDQLISRFTYPQPRVAMAPLLRLYASAAVDISDGLLADAGHIAVCSNVALKIDKARLPLSKGAHTILAKYPDEWPQIWSGGDDYELLCCVRAASVPAFEAKVKETGISCTSVGRVVAGAGVYLYDGDGLQIDTEKQGFQHF